MGWFGRKEERNENVNLNMERRTCRDCQKVFPSRNKLMQHLERENNYEEYGIRETKKERSEREDLLRKEEKLIEERKRSQL